jgi:hypothetical protein
MERARVSQLHAHIKIAGVMRRDSCGNMRAVEVGAHLPDTVGGRMRAAVLEMPREMQDDLFTEACPGARPDHCSGCEGLVLRCAGDPGHRIALCALCLLESVSRGSGIVHVLEEPE